jgi:hypothetical protein
LATLDWTKPMQRDDIGDGWDAISRVQVIPKLGKRYMRLRTGPLPVEVRVEQRLSCWLENFHVVHPFGKVVPELPPRGRTVHTVTLPAEIEVEFDIQAGGITTYGDIEVRQLHGKQGQLKSSDPDLKLMVLIIREQVRHFLVCDVFDEINTTVAARAQIGQAIGEANKVYTSQANMSILKTGEVKLILPGSIGPSSTSLISHWRGD